MKCRKVSMSSLLVVGLLPSLLAAQEIVLTEDDFAEKPVYSPYAGRDYADNVYFGDMHFHTDLSFDAGLIGTTLTAHEGFRMARGEK
ncbi:MAG: DUF3604 domain-containing protein, partial [Planctomycetota bacterium]